MSISTKYLDDVIVSNANLFDKLESTNDHLKEFFDIPTHYHDHFDNQIGIMCEFFYKMGQIEGHYK